VNEQGLRTNDQEQITIHFEVEDTGSGIALEEINNLFEAFVQTETGKRSQEGTGLGLAISRKFVQLMGGDITVNSVLEQGSIFAFDIQVNVAEMSQLNQSSHLARLHPITPSPHTVIIALTAVSQEVTCSKFALIVEVEL
jgi:nitrogen-specific signal transduction histidine kinase